MIAGREGICHHTLVLVLFRTHRADREARGSGNRTASSAELEIENRPDASMGSSKCRAGCFIQKYRSILSCNGFCFAARIESQQAARIDAHEEES
jgi:hypothetical protein